MEDTTITLHRTGGIVAVMKSANVALSQLPPEDRKRWEAWVREFLPLAAKAKSAGQERSGARDTCDMALEVSTPEGKQRLEFDDRSIPAPLLPMVSELAAKLRPAKPS